MFTEFIKIKVKNGKVLVVGTAHGEETTEWCSLEEIRKAIEAAEQSVHPTRGSVAQKEPLPTEHPIKIARG